MSKIDCRFIYKEFCYFDSLKKKSPIKLTFTVVENSEKPFLFLKIILQILFVNKSNPVLDARWKQTQNPI